MIDIVDSRTRSRMMSAIRGRDTRPERRLRSALHAAGLRFRLHGRDLPGRPDIILPRFRAVVFVHGCFWHRHDGCRFSTTPATRTEFWQAKFSANVARDARTEALLLDAGWSVAVVWECTLAPMKIDLAAERLTAWLRTTGREARIEIGVPS